MVTIILICKLTRQTWIQAAGLHQPGARSRRPNDVTVLLRSQQAVASQLPGTHRTRLASERGRSGLQLLLLRDKSCANSVSNLASNFLITKKSRTLYFWHLSYTRLPPADDKRVRGERSQRVSQRELQRHAQTLGHRSFLLWTRSVLLVNII